MTYDLGTLVVSVVLAFATGYGLAVIHDDRRHRRELYERDTMRAAAERYTQPKKGHRQP